MDELLTWLYLKGLSTNDFPEALQAFHTQDLTKKRYAYWYLDGVYFQARMSEKQCMLVILGVDETGKKELVALQSGFWESEIA